MRECVTTHSAALEEAASVMRAWRQLPDRPKSAAARERGITLQEWWAAMVRCLYDVHRAYESFLRDLEGKPRPPPRPAPASPLRIARQTRVLLCRRPCPHATTFNSIADDVCEGH